MAGNALVQQLISDETRIYALKSDGTIWACDAIPPLVWRQIKPFTGTGRPVSLSVAVVEPSFDPKALYTLSSDGTIWFFDYLNQTWNLENAP